MKFLDVEIVTPPAGIPVTVDEFIDHARLNGLTVDRQPDLLERELRAATRRGEQYCRRSFLTQTLAALFVPGDSTGAGALVMVLPRGKVQELKQVLSGGVPLDPAVYALDGNIVTLAAPLGTAATALYDSGYGDDPADVPDGIKEGILEYATVLYENRGGAREQKYAASGSQQIPDGVRDLWRPFQVEISG